MNQDKIWQAALGQLELKVSQGNFLTWFRDTKIKEIKNGVVIVQTPSAFAHEWLSKKYHQSILEALQSLDKTIKQVKFKIFSGTKTYQPIKNNYHILAQKKNRSSVVANEAINKNQDASNATRGSNTNVDQKNNSKTFVAHTNINPKYTFSEFVIGPTNEVAHAACKAVSTKPGNAYNPLFIYGGVGLGKTHLMQAAGNAMLEKDDTLKICYVPAEKFIDDFVRAIRDRDPQVFKDYYRNIDVLMMDDVQFLAGKSKTQEELFHTFNSLYSQNKQIILTSDRSPKLIPTFEERLRSRLTGGMMVDIQQPDYETRLAILEEKAEMRGLEIDQDSLAYIAKNIQKNVRELEGALNRVAAHCELHKKSTSLEYTQKILRGVIDKPQQRTIDSSKIIGAVSSYFNVSQEDLCGKCRKQDIVRPRQVAMFLLRKENNSSFPSIGDNFGGRDHTTAMHACEKIEKMLEHDENLLQDVNFIKEKIYA